jgi:two-component system, chemotaxis family, chemotaxis protein CheY
MSVRVLIADSSPSARDVLRQHLECGHCVVAAETESARQAIDLFRVTRPDVVTLDVGLKASDGCDARTFFKTIRSESPQTSIVIVDTTGRRRDVGKYVREGALDCVIESFDNYAMEQMWRRLSQIYPELRRTEGMASGR